MCELLAMSANVPTDICFSFAGLIQRGGKTGPHKDGWGITFYEGKGCRTFKDPQPCYRSEIAQLVSRYAIKSEAVISHIRQANSGGVNLENTHPFTRELWGRNLTYAHNGQLDGYHIALQTTSLTAIGSTDSEQAFVWLIEQLREKFGHRKPDNETLFAYLAQLCVAINQFGVFNMILSDGEFVFAYCYNNLHYLTRRAPFGPARLKDADVTIDFTQETTERDIVTVIATAPLTIDERWTKMQSGQWCAFIGGQLIASGQLQAPKVKSHIQSDLKPSTLPAEADKVN
ncbi:class II glutamine amidotransferase [Thalassotalea ponticola]|uniref:class II glutamine amidotransferase n=1 Tax=Thalassotalea ponticola TaxID=1523392 RepID=UPI0025B5DD2E|nr:class II glutamine amidotransferase [Thalassotalea ponticola]MDN3653017.1 class II glutamine amidotransferase [Thalassotalea ponticola]